MGFQVLPKAPINLEAPQIGLRPTINTNAPGALGAAIQSISTGRVCVAYMMNSKCDLGSRCTEAHITDPEEEMRIRARFKQQDCHSGASCRRVGCLFRHPG